MSDELFCFLHIPSIWNVRPDDENARLLHWSFMHCFACSRCSQQVCEQYMWSHVQCFALASSSARSKYASSVCSHLQYLHSPFRPKPLSPCSLSNYWLSQPHHVAAHLHQRDLHVATSRYMDMIHHTIPWGFRYFFHCGFCFCLGSHHIFGFAYYICCEGCRCRCCEGCRCRIGNFLTQTPPKRI